MNAPAAAHSSATTRNDNGHLTAPPIHACNLALQQEQQQQQQQQQHPHPLPSPLPSPSPASPAPPSVLLAAADRYIKTTGQQPLATTEHATLIEAHDTLSGTDVVLKRPHDAVRSAHELTVLRTLRDYRVPNAVVLLDSFADDDSGASAAPVLVFRKLMPIPALNEVDLVVIARWVRAIAETLARIHDLKIAHAALAPSSLMLTGPAEAESSSLFVTSWGDAQFLTGTPPPAPRPHATAISSSSPPAQSPQSSLYSQPTSPPLAAVTAAAAPAPRSFTAPDLHALGSLLGRWLEPYLPSSCALNYLHSPFVRKSTTTYIARKLVDKLDAQRMGRGGERGWHPAVAAAADLLARLLEPALGVDDDDEKKKAGRSGGGGAAAREVLAHPFCRLAEADFEGTDRVAWRSEVVRAGVRGARAYSPQEREPKISFRG
ncbi:hypothetical protein BDZ88DRAFT_454900 [Geranomyces variabilis]|nr:hypothetical protein BDZ88DRAFT_454900 [Geranomyces variabilis]KAJ3132344.1 hypothetical protein HDU90_007405 [Geranomyces variabilis]